MLKINSAVPLYVLGGMMLSLAGVLFKPLSGIFSAIEIAAWRGVVVLITVMLIRKASGLSLTKLPLTFSRWQWFSACSFVLQTIAFSVAILLTSTADTFMISNAAPLYMVLWQFLFERRLPSTVELIAVAIAIVGLSLFLMSSLTGVHGSGQYFGLGAALVAGIAFAGHIYGQGKVGKEGMINDERATQGSVILGTALVCVAAFPLIAVFPGERVSAAPGWSILCIVALGVFQLAIPMMLWARTLPFIPPLFAAFMPTLIAIWAPLWTKLVLGEPFPGALALCGAAIVHFSVLVAAVRRAK